MSHHHLPPFSSHVVSFERACQVLGPIRCFYAKRDQMPPGQWLLDQKPATYEQIMEAAGRRLEQLHG